MDKTLQQISTNIDCTIQSLRNALQSASEVESILIISFIERTAHLQREFNSFWNAHEHDQQPK